jgi:catechol 2,3-dioxygenase-like lactoylglutathione lyase family enzyme
MAAVAAGSGLVDIATIGIPCIDQARSLDFYVNYLGLELRVDTMRGQERWIEVAPAGATTTIALLRGPDQVRMGIDTQIRLTCRDAAALRTDLQWRGVDVDREIRHSPMPTFGLRDPDKNRLIVEQR